MHDLETQTACQKALGQFQVYLKVIGTGGAGQTLVDGLMPERAARKSHNSSRHTGLQAVTTTHPRPLMSYLGVLKGHANCTSAPQNCDRKQDFVVGSNRLHARFRYRKSRQVGGTAVGRSWLKRIADGKDAKAGCEQTLVTVG